MTTEKDTTGGTKKRSINWAAHLGKLMAFTYERKTRLETVQKRCKEIKKKKK